MADPRDWTAIEKEPCTNEGCEGYRQGNMIACPDTPPDRAFLVNFEFVAFAGPVACPFIAQAVREAAERG